VVRHRGRLLRLPALAPLAELVQLPEVRGDVVLGHVSGGRYKCASCKLHTSLYVAEAEVPELTRLATAVSR
jgi:hypothetical protein